MNIDFKKKYLKYKKKYLLAKDLKVNGGSDRRSSKDDIMEEQFFPIDSNRNSPFRDTPLSERSYSSLASVDSFINLDSMMNEDLTIEYLKFEDIDEFILVSLSSREICDFLYFESSINVLTPTEFLENFHIFFEIFKYEKYGDMEMVYEFEKMLKKEKKFDESLISELKNITNQIFDNAKKILESIVLKDEGNLNELNYDLLQNYIRVVKYKGYILGYYRYHLNFNSEFYELLEDSSFIDNQERKEFFIKLNNDFSNGLPFNVVYVAQMCSFSRVNKIYPQKYLQDNISSIYEDYKLKFGSKNSIGKLLWNDIKDLVSKDPELSQKSTFILLYIDDENVEPYHKSHGSFQLKDYKSSETLFEILNDDMVRFISDTFNISPEVAIKFKKYIFYLVEEDYKSDKTTAPEIWANLISLEEKAERRNK